MYISLYGDEILGYLVPVTDLAICPYTSGKQCLSLAGSKVRTLIFNRPRFGSSRVAPPPPKKFGNPGDRLRKKKWDLDQLPKFEKNFYSEHPEIHNMSQVINSLYI